MNYRKQSFFVRNHQKKKKPKMEVCGASSVKRRQLFFGTSFFFVSGTDKQQHDINEYQS
jgi:hypothetical protein